MLKKTSAAFLIGMSACLFSCEKVGNLVSPENVSQLPILIGPDFHISINNEQFKVSGFDMCSEDHSIAGNWCIRIEPATAFVKVKIHTSPSIIEQWSVKHENGNKKISFIRPNGELVIGSPIEHRKNDN